MEQNMNLDEITPTVKGYETAFLGLLKLLKEGKIHEDEYLILDIYARMSTEMKIEELLEQISGKKFVMVRKDSFWHVVRA